MVHGVSNGTPYESRVLASEGTVWEEHNRIIGDNTGNPMYDSNWIANSNGSRIHTHSPITPISSSLVSDYVVANVGCNMNSYAHDTRLINNF